MAEMPFIDLTRCNGCGECLKVCNCHALVLVNNVVVLIETDDCGWCTECEAVCPTQAISCAFEIIIEDL
ncbi:MAG: 4Fe-4S ferredoxin [Chloroflexi bacterium]|nr:4Fe-4S ferredoxin [Chloroflexota bacterium]